MRDSFGGVFMIRLFLVFIFIYVAFSAVSLNYAKAFRMKNKVIDFIEENEIISLESANFNSKIDTLNAILPNTLTCDAIGESEGATRDHAGEVIKYCTKGVVIEKISEERITGTSSKIIRYQISTHAEWNLGVLNKILILGGKKENSENYINGTWTVTGEAKVVARG